MTAKASGLQTPFCLLYICYINLNRLGIKRWQMGQPVGQLSRAGSWHCWRPPALCFGASWTNTGHGAQLFRYSSSPLKMGLYSSPLFPYPRKGDTQRCHYTLNHYRLLLFLFHYAYHSQLSTKFIGSSAKWKCESFFQKIGKKLLLKALHFFLFLKCFLFWCTMKF